MAFLFAMYDSEKRKIEQYIEFYELDKRSTGSYGDRMLLKLAQSDRKIKTLKQKLIALEVKLLMLGLNHSVMSTWRNDYAFCITFSWCITNITSI